MKKNTVVALMLVGAILLCLLLFGGSTGEPDPDFLRIHIRADSDAAEAQDVKYLVKDAVVDLLAPGLASCHSKSDAIELVRDNLSEIEQTANRVLAEEGFCYEAHARVTAEEFPERTYQDLTLPSGVYDALIVELGSGKGQNWWCVVYPPLCFVNYDADGSQGIVYRSKLLEIIRNFLEQNK